MNKTHQLIAFKSHCSDIWGVGKNDHPVPAEQVGILLDKRGAHSRIVWGGPDVKVRLTAGERLALLCCDFGVEFTQRAPCAEGPDAEVTWRASLRLCRPSDETTPLLLLQALSVPENAPEEVFGAAFCAKVAEVFQQAIQEYFRPLKYSERRWDEDDLGVRLQEVVAAQPALALVFQQPPVKPVRILSVVSQSIDAQNKVQDERRTQIEGAQAEADFQEALRRLEDLKLERSEAHELHAAIVKLRHSNRLDVEAVLAAARVLQQQVRVEFLRQQIAAIRHQGEMSRRAESAQAELAEIECAKARVQLQLQEKALEHAELQKQSFQEQRRHQGRVEAELGSLQGELKAIQEREARAAEAAASTAESLKELRFFVQRTVQRVEADAARLEAELAKEQGRRRTVEEILQAMEQSEGHWLLALQSSVQSIDELSARLDELLKTNKTEAERARSEQARLLAELQAVQQAGSAAGDRLAKLADRVQGLQAELIKLEGAGQVARREVEDRLAAAQAEKQVLEEQLRRHQEEASRLTASLDEYRQTISRLSDEIGRRTREKEALEADLGEAKRRQEELERQQAKSQQALDEAGRQLDSHAASVRELTIELRVARETNSSNVQRLETALAEVQAAKAQVERDHAKLDSENREARQRLARQIEHHRQSAEKIDKRATELGAEKARLARELAETKGRLEEVEERRRQAQLREDAVALQMKTSEAQVERLNHDLREQAAAAKTERTRLEEEMEGLKREAQARAQAHISELDREKRQREEQERQAEARVLELLAHIEDLSRKLAAKDEASAVELARLRYELALSEARKAAAEREQEQQQAERAAAVQKLQQLDERIARKSREAAELTWKRYELIDVRGRLQARPLPMDWILPGGAFLQVAVQAHQPGWFYLLALCRALGTAPNGQPRIEYKWETLYANDRFNTLDYSFHRPQANWLNAGDCLVLPKDGLGEGELQQYWQLDNVAGGYEYLYALFCPRKLTLTELSEMQLNIPSREFTTRGFSNAKGFVGAAHLTQPGAPLAAAEDPGWDHLQQFSQRVIENMTEIAGPDSLVREFVIFHS